MFRRRNVSGPRADEIRSQVKAGKRLVEVGDGPEGLYDDLYVVSA